MKMLYAGAFAAGFEIIIPSLLTETVPDAQIERIDSALVLFSSTHILKEEDLPFINTLYVSVSVWNTNTVSFSDLCRKISFTSLQNLLPPFLGGKKTYRLRFSKENQFSSVDKGLVTSVEKSITAITGLVPDRVNAKTEFHLIIRRESLSFFALKLTEKGSTEKLYEKGELRSETVRLMLSLVQTSDEDFVMCDPFAGYGSIPRQITALFPHTHIYINDIDPILAKNLRKEFSDNAKFTVSSCEASSLTHIEKNSVNLIITDPPWGSFDTSITKEALPSFYKNMLKEFDRILSIGGRAAVLTGAKSEFEAALSSSVCFSKSINHDNFRTDILINGKKAAVYCIMKEY